MIKMDSRQDTILLFFLTGRTRTQQLGSSEVLALKLPPCM